MREPIILKTETEADLQIEIKERWALLSLHSPLAMASTGIMLNLAEIQELQQALGKAAAHLRGMKRAA